MGTSLGLFVATAGMDYLNRLVEDIYAALLPEFDERKKNASAAPPEKTIHVCVFSAEGDSDRIRMLVHVLDVQLIEVFAG